MLEDKVLSSSKDWNNFVETHWCVFIDGASGSGKSTFKCMLLEDRDFSFEYAKRYTTRERRSDDDVTDDYDFIDRGNFDKLVQARDMIEYRHFLFGMSYGISKHMLVSAGKRSKEVLSVMNLGGISLVKEAIPTSVCILIDSPIPDIEVRLRLRGLNNEEQIAERLKNAEQVRNLLSKYDYVVDNKQGHLLSAYRTLKSFLEYQRGRT